MNVESGVCVNLTEVVAYILRMSSRRGTILTISRALIRQCQSLALERAKTQSSGLHRHDFIAILWL